MIALGSCYFLADPEPAVERQHLRRRLRDLRRDRRPRRPDLMVLDGRQPLFPGRRRAGPGVDGGALPAAARLPPLQALLTATSHVATWDDHDYGPNDADPSYTHEGRVAGALPALLGEPGLRAARRAGVFGRVRSATSNLPARRPVEPDGERRADGPDKTMFGAAAARVAARRAALFARAAKAGRQRQRSSGTARTDSKAGTASRASSRLSRNGWRRSASRGVVFVSGDRHWGELLKTERPGAYPLYELTTSPLAAKALARHRRARRCRPRHDLRQAAVRPDPRDGPRQRPAHRPGNARPDRRARVATGDFSTGPRSRR